MKYKKLNKLVILCGGTGGHFYPGLTIARKLQESGAEAYIFIGGHKDKISKQAQNASKYNIICYTINSSKLIKKPIAFIKFIINLAIGFLKARRLLKKIKPEAILGMGSFTSLPVSFAAISLKIPLFLHDGNARIGRANVFLSNWARLTMSAFPAVNERVLKSDYQRTGMPIRSELTDIQLSKKKAIEEINKLYKVSFKSENKTILIFGGSQGALTINKVLPLAVQQLKNDNLQIVHLFGSDTEINPYKDSVKQSLILKSSDKMSLLYSIADLVVSRSGGSTIAELEYFGKTAILIPYPYASELHQNDNADFYVNNSNSVMLLNINCNEDSMAKLINEKLHIETKKTSENASIRSIAENILFNIDKRI
jgi:UDP-N-acetylglucosamine--N-acetylmuramyl-(pentapeptide) pyrophosphoryl-undecaprenol N-acetylglucosamine transferase